MFSRVRKEEGFGLIELLMAVTVLNLGILAIVAAFNSGIVSIKRSSQISTASALADAQMELYRGLPYTSISLTTGTIPGTAPYSTDTALANGVSQITAACAAPASAVAACVPSQTVLGADHRSYHVDTYIVASLPCPTHLNCTTNPWTPDTGRALKIVTVVVRDNSTAATLNARPLARVVSTFDQSTG